MDDAAATAAALRDLTATQALAALAEGRATSVALVTAALERAEALADLHPVITLDRDGALAAAADSDAARAAGEPLGALAGLPVLVKDNIDVAGLPTTGGTPALEHHRPAADAEVVARLRAAGAVVLAKTNLHELAFGITTTNATPFAGVAENPWDRTRIPGGSSGGTAIGVAARVAPLGLSTDTGGSGRIPPAFTGVVGLRPSVGDGGERRWPLDGVLPISAMLDTVCPTGRTVRDVALLDAVVTGAGVPEPVSLAGQRLGVVAQLWEGLAAEVEDTARTALDRLAGAGAVLVDVDLPDLLVLAGAVVFPVALHDPLTDVPAYLAASGAEVTLEEVVTGVASPDVRGLMGVVTGDEHAGHADAVDVRRPALQRLIAGTLADLDLAALVFPTSPVPPAVIDRENGSGTTSVDGGEPVDTFATTVRNCMPASSAGTPGLSLPAGLAPSGLPVGLSLEGALGSDTDLLALGLAVEDVLGTLPAPPV
ncbi:amidase family protein [uncultured Nocardioides sp.]|uniref:amidase family protein n=1 Tax=uncultured Nocardioides sp. TaxID=198441 RepID=UPI00263A3B32|nr:amidase family protein [uncultured Nocardioides sp.]